MSKREPTVAEQLAEAKPVDPESLAADPPLSDEEFEAFEQALRWPDDERVERLEGALRMIRDLANARLAKDEQDGTMRDIAKVAHRNLDA